MGFDIGINFRATSTFVVDVTNETYCLGDTYPTTRGGVTFGWSSGASARDRSASVDRRLAGINFVAGNAGSTFRVDLPSSGSVDVHIAIGDDAAQQNNQKWQIKDNATQLVSHGPVTAVSGAHFLDETATDYADTAWPGSQTAETFTFSSTTFFFVPNSGTADNQVIAHIRLVQAGGGGGPTTAVKSQSLGSTTWSWAI